MIRSNALRTAESLAFAAALVVPLAASTAPAEEPMLHLRAFAVDLNNRVRTETVDIVIERW